MTASQNHPINCGEADSEFAFNFAKQTIDQRSADLIVSTEYKVLVPGSSSTATIGDTSYSRVVADVAGTNARLDLSYRLGRITGLRAAQSSNASILSPSANDPLLFEYAGDGTAKLTVELANGEKITTPFSSQTVTSQTQDVFTSFAPGSLSRHLFDQIRLYANGSTSSPNHYAIYSTFNQAADTYEKSTGFWGAALDWSGMMVNKSGSGGVTRVTAITPHHAIGSAHYAPQIGDVIVFCDSNNQTASRTISDRRLLVDNPDLSEAGIPSGFDSVVVKFSEPLPTLVKKYKTLPTNYADYAPINVGLPYSNNASLQSSRMIYCPIISTSHYRWDANWPLQRSNRYAYINQISEFGLVNFRPAVNAPNDFSDYSGITSGLRGGDSGGPCFLIINGELVLTNCLTASSGGPLHASFLGEIQAAIDSLGPGGQTYETVDLSQFTNFAS